MSNYANIPGEAIAEIIDCYDAAEEAITKFQETYPQYGLQIPSPGVMLHLRVNALIACLKQEFRELNMHRCQTHQDVSSFVATLRYYQLQQIIWGKDYYEVWYWRNNDADL